MVLLSFSSHYIFLSKYRTYANQTILPSIFFVLFFFKLLLIWLFVFYFVQKVTMDHHKHCIFFSYSFRKNFFQHRFQLSPLVIFSLQKQAGKKARKVESQLALAQQLLEKKRFYSRSYTHSTLHSRCSALSHSYKSGPS